MTKAERERRDADPARRAAHLQYLRDYRKTRAADEIARSRERRKDPAYNAAQNERKRRWREANRARHLAVSRAYDARQMRENAQRRLSKNLRHRLSKAMTGQTRGVSAVTALGASVAEFRAHIERLFSDGMAWDNYGAWHLDHVIPLSAFDLSDPEQAAKACHYSNIQPLWAIDNQRKSAKIPKHLSPSTPHQSDPSTCPV